MATQNSLVKLLSKLITSLGIVSKFRLNSSFNNRLINGFWISVNKEIENSSLRNRMACILPKDSFQNRLSNSFILIKGRF